MFDLRYHALDASTISLHQYYSPGDLSQYRIAVALQGCNVLEILISLCKQSAFNTPGCCPQQENYYCRETSWGLVYGLKGVYRGSVGDLVFTPLKAGKIRRDDVLVAIELKTAPLFSATYMASSMALEQWVSFKAILLPQTHPITPGILQL